MTKTTAILATSVLITIIVAYVILLAMGADVTELSNVVLPTIVPTVVTLFAYNKASQAAHNTNGRMTELIQNNAMLASIIENNMPDQLTTEESAALSVMRQEDRIRRGN